MNGIETKIAGGRVMETEEAERNGVHVGLIEGYIATWDLDDGGIFGVPDKFHPGAFAMSLKDHRSRNNRPIRLKDHHGRTIGGFPIETAKEDEIGLFAIGEINIETQCGREAFSLARQGVLSDLSIGFSTKDTSIDKGIRNIFEAIVWEGSIVDEPANRAAVFTEVKNSLVPFQDLPLAHVDHVWDPEAALERITVFTNSKAAPTPAFRKCFIWADDDISESFEAYKLQIADVVNDTLVAIPAAVKAAAEAIQESEMIPAVGFESVVQHVERYFAKMDVESPFERKDRQFFTADEVKIFTPRDMEEALAKTGTFSKGAARLIAARIGGASVSLEKSYDELEDDEMTSLLENIKGASSSLKD